MIIFINGRQKRMRRPALIEGIPVDDFIVRNADPLWLHALMSESCQRFTK